MARDIPSRTAGALAIATVILAVIVMRGTATARDGMPPVPAAMPGASAPLPPATPGGATAPASPAALGHTEPAGAAARTSAGSAAPAAAIAVARTEPSAASPGQTEHVAPSVTHGGSIASAAEHAGPPARPVAASRRASTRAPSSSSSAAAVASRAADTAAPLALPAHPAEACSEITCIVDGYADPCCAIFRRPAAGGAPAPRAELPDSLDRAAIASGLGRIDTRGCGQQSPAHGDVKVSVKVSPAGAVTGVTVNSSPDPVLDACVTAAVRNGTFPATQRGGSFAYVWRF